MPLERISSSAPTGTQASCYSEDALRAGFLVRSWESQNCLETWSLVTSVHVDSSDRRD